MAFTSRLATSESTLASEMVAGVTVPAVVGPDESVTSTLSMSHVVQVEIEYGLQHALGLSQLVVVATEPTEPMPPLVIVDGKVQQGSALDMGNIEITRFVSSNYVTTTNEKVIICEAAITLTLIAAADFVRQRLYIKNTFAGTVTIETDGSEMIDNLSSATLAQWESLTLFSTGTGWIIL